MNVGTFIVLLIVAAVVGLVIFVMHRDKKNGKNSCGENCSGCAAAGMCHSHKQKKKLFS